MTNIKFQINFQYLNLKIIIVGFLIIFLNSSAFALMPDALNKESFVGVSLFGLHGQKKINEQSSWGGSVSMFPGVFFAIIPAHIYKTEKITPNVSSIIGLWGSYGVDSANNYLIYAPAIEYGFCTAYEFSDYLIGRANLTGSIGNIYRSSTKTNYLIILPGISTGAELEWKINKFGIILGVSFPFTLLSVKYNF